MSTEYELRTIISESETKSVRQTLRRLGAKNAYGETYIERWILKIRGPTSANDTWLRIRANPESDEMTLKSDDMPGQSTEISVGISDAKTAVEILNLAGLPTERYQQTLREKWELGDVVITIDTWPRLGRVLEVESTSSATRVYNAISQIQISRDRFTDHGIVRLYKDIASIDILKMRNLKFAPSGKSPTTMGHPSTNPPRSATNNVQSNPLSQKPRRSN